MKSSCSTGGESADQTRKRVRPGKREFVRESTNRIRKTAIKFAPQVDYL